MFNPEDRSRIRSEILEYGHADLRISGAAITGSAAAGREDRWSDIDLAFGVHEDTELSDVVRDWTTYIYDLQRALHHVDVLAGPWIYRVFLLPNTLQVDLAFAPAQEFRALAASFQLVFGTAQAPRYSPPQPANEIVGLGWLYALHARSSIARGKYWQAEYMISGLRDHTLALACLKRGLSAVHGRGLDELPKEITADLEASLIGRLDREHLSRAFGVALDAFLNETRRVEPELEAHLREALTALKSSPS
jgi:predicted nucleotidyltransferase